MVWTILWGVLVVVVGAFAFVIAFGAPYLPTLSPQVKTALDLIDLQPGETLLELGSGDGRVLMAAAERGINGIGYELNPLLVLYSWLRTRKYGKHVKIVWGNYWRKTLPPAQGIFVFLLNPYMEKLHKKVIQEFSQPVKLVSFAFKIPGKKATREKDGLFLYRY